MRPFRFIHASDLHLEQPPYGLAERPTTCTLLVETPYRAALNVFEAALRHEVDFVVLAGDLIDPHRSGPRGVLFLHEQFQRLGERGIQLFWAGGEVDRPGDWPESVRWPNNVHIFPADDVGRFEAVRQQQSIAALWGQSNSSHQAARVAGSAPEDFVALGLDLFSIGVFHGELPNGIVEASPIRYWALGGEHEATLPQETTPVVHYSGSPQGRCPVEAGPHSATLVEVDEQGRIETKPVATDVVRFLDELVVVPAAMSRTELESEMRGRLQRLIAENGDVALCVSWALSSPELGKKPSAAAHAPVLLGVLRGEFGYSSPPAWSSAIDIQTPPTLPAEWFEQETLLGDFLRATRRHEADESTPLDLRRYLPPAANSLSLQRAAFMEEQPIREQALHEAAWLGASLLSPEEADA